MSSLHFLMELRLGIDVSPLPTFAAHNFCHASDCVVHFGCLLQEIMNLAVEPASYRGKIEVSQLTMPSVFCSSLSQCSKKLYYCLRVHGKLTSWYNYLMSILSDTKINYSPIFDW